jgi:hypothetical protein
MSNVGLHESKLRPNRNSEGSRRRGSRSADEGGGTRFAIRGVRAHFRGQDWRKQGKRSEGPTRLRKSQRETLNAFESDQLAIDEELAQQLDALETSVDVIQALHFGMQPSIEVDQKSLRHYHPDDLPIGQELLRRKDDLGAALAEFLVKHPNAA